MVARNEALPEISESVANRIFEKYKSFTYADVIRAMMTEGKKDYLKVLMMLEVDAFSVPEGNTRLSYCFGAIFTNDLYDSQLKVDNNPIELKLQNNEYSNMCEQIFTKMSNGYGRDLFKLLQTKDISPTDPFTVTLAGLADNLSENDKLTPREALMGY